MRSHSSWRRHPAAVAALLMGALTVTGGIYVVAAPGPATASVAGADMVEEGRKLFNANCSTCHGSNGEGRSDEGGKILGPSLIGVGAASVDFQVGTGRMPLAAPGVQAMRNTPQFDEKQTEQMAAYVASLGNGPAIPPASAVTAEGGDPSRGANIFRVNCAMCHNFAGSGGALTRGKFAPPLRDIEGKHIYEAMVTGPQAMPVFSDTNISPQAKKDIISYLRVLDEDKSPGGHSLGNLGPVGDGYFLWLFGIPLMLAAALWLGKRAA